MHVIACGAIARHVDDVAKRRGWDLVIHPLPPLLHNSPTEIAGAVEAQILALQGDSPHASGSPRGRSDAPVGAERLRTAGDLENGSGEDAAARLAEPTAYSRADSGGTPRIIVAYADCGTYGALDDVIERHHVGRLRGQHCYDVFGGASDITDMLASQPGTYFFTDYLVKSFHRSVVVELGLDRHPELRDDYFRHYTRVVWLAQSPTEELRASARDAAAVMGLPLEEVPCGDFGLETELELLLLR